MGKTLIKVLVVALLQHYPGKANVKRCIQWDESLTLLIYCSYLVPNAGMGFNCTEQNYGCMWSIYVIEVWKNHKT